MDYAIVSEKGERQVNEDAVAAVECDGNWLFVLADGLGGHGHGEVASGIVTEAARDILDGGQCGFEKTGDLIETVLEEAQARLFERQEKDSDLSSYKTTAVLLAVSGDSVRWGYIGDSRLYYFRKNRLMTRTLDHSVPQMLVNAGKLKEKQIRGHEDRNKLLRVLGTRYESVKYVIDIPVRREERQAFLLCSDGFWEWIDEKKMIRLLKKSHSAQEWLDLMTEEVVKNGRGNHMDNYSAAAILL